MHSLCYFLSCIKFISNSIYFGLPATPAVPGNRGAKLRNGNDKHRISKKQTQFRIKYCFETVSIRRLLNVVFV